MQFYLEAASVQNNATIKYIREHFELTSVRQRDLLDKPKKKCLTCQNLLFELFKNSSKIWNVKPENIHTTQPKSEHF